MIFWSIEPNDWFRRVFGSGVGSQRTGQWRDDGGGDVFREFEDMRREMERMFEEQLRYSINKVGDDMRKHYTKV
jgi:HSP20 family protein